MLQRIDMTTAATMPRPMSDVATGLKMGVYAAHASGLWFILVVTMLRLEERERAASMARQE